MAANAKSTPAASSATANPNRVTRDPRTRIPLLLAAILIATFMTSIEVTIVTTALPTITSDLHGLSEQNWVFTMYLLTTAISTPIYGKVSDQIGRKPVFIIGVALFALGSGLCGIAMNMPTLIAFRALQGLGAGAIFPVTFTIIADVFPLGQRSKIISLNNVAWGVSALLGPLVGGFIVDQINWHWIFFINVPLGAIALIFILLSFHDDPAVLARATHTRTDFAGIVALIFTLSSFLLALQWLGQGKMAWEWIAGAFVIFAVSAAAFYRIEKRAESPIIPLTLFSNRTFTVQIVTASVLNGLQIGFQVYFPMWTQSIYHTPPSLAGLIITPSSIMWFFASFFVGAVMRRFPPRTIAIPTAIIQMIAYSFMIFAGLDFPIIMFYIVSGVCGFGLGLIITMNTIVSQAVVPEGYVGTATGTLTLGRTLGQTLMTGIFGLIFNLTVSAHISQHNQLNLSIMNKAVTTESHQHLSAGTQMLVDDALLNAYHLIFLTVVVFYVIVVVVNLLDPMRKPLVQVQAAEEEKVRS